MTKLLGPPDDTDETSPNTMYGLLYGTFCDHVQPDRQQIGHMKALLVAWHLTEAWLPGSVGYRRRLHMVQARSCFDAAMSIL